ncbi:MAG: hypothetical protein ACT4PP_15800 [Sporichthyaceae bacterium]
MIPDTMVAPIEPRGHRGMLFHALAQHSPTQEPVSVTDLSRFGRSLLIHERGVLFHALATGFRADFWSPAHE